MELKTKFGLRDTVYFMSENKVHKGDVMEISLNLKTTPEGNMENISYHVYDYSVSAFIKLNESVLYSSKEELLKSL